MEPALTVAKGPLRHLTICHMVVIDRKEFDKDETSALQEMARNRPITFCFIDFTESEGTITREGYLAVCEKHFEKTRDVFLLPEGPKVERCLDAAWAATQEGWGHYYIENGRLMTLVGIDGLVPKGELFNP